MHLYNGTFLHRYISALQQLTALCFPLAVAMQVSQPLGWGRSWEHHRLLLLDKPIRSAQISVSAPPACCSVALQYSLGYRQGRAWGVDAGSDPVLDKSTIFLPNKEIVSGFECTRVLGYRLKAFAFWKPHYGRFHEFQWDVQVPKVK